MAVKEIKAATTKELEREVLALLEQGAIVLTGNPRLVKELFRLHRSRKLGTEEKAWVSPDISSFRFFVDRSYESLWPERRQLSYESSLLLWMEVLRGSGLPDTRDLAGEFHRAFNMLESYNVDPAKVSDDTQNLGRNGLFDAFRKMIYKRGLITYAGAVAEVRAAVLGKSMELPGLIAVTGPEELLPVEKELLDAVSERTEIVKLSLSPDRARVPFVELFETFEEEAEVVAGRAVDDRISGAQRVAILYNEDKYRKKLEEIFSDICEETLAGKDPDGPGPGTAVSLAETPLFSLLDLALGIGSGLPDEKLLSVVATPSFKGHGLLDMNEWGELATSVRREGGRGLRRVIEKFGIGEELSPFIHPKAKETKLWIADSKAFLAMFDLSGDGFEARCIEVLGDCFRFLEAERGGEVSGLEQFRGSLAVVCGNAKVEAGTAPCAGVEVLALEEGAGLSFEKVYIVGCRQGALPPPLPKHPLLHPIEKQQMDDLSLKADYLRNERIFMSVLAGAESVFLSRPLADGDTPLLPTPFAPDGERHGPFNIYLSGAGRVPGRSWLARALEASPAKRRAPRLIERKDYLPEKMSVTNATDLFSCPFKFFMKDIAKVEEPAEAASLPSPLEWGLEIHRVLEACAPVIRENAGKAPVEELWKRLMAKTEECVRKSRLKEELKEPVRQFLLGREGKIGLMGRLAIFEDDRASSGWRIVAEETSFHGERVAGFDFLLKGKIDRIDVSPAANRIEVIDYKSGSSVTDAARCQVSLYKKMVGKKIAGELEEGAAPPVVSGGILPLRNEDLKLTEVKAEKDEDHIGRIASMWKAMKEGTVAADPFSDNECRSCVYFSLCHKDEVGTGWGVEDE
ncbi:MAG TPA: PD-(D/E)XK nuclease family protein [Acidobacteriota bacterium]|nr:PD-(D/E)XK nuclease family protein [Acidobacteriota bacterium]HQQ47518.1 PD-(D/E)XK nuclease family protein [Acidobacteriota bacterium]